MLILIKNDNTAYFKFFRCLVGFLMILDSSMANPPVIFGVPVSYVPLYSYPAYSPYFSAPGLIGGTIFGARFLNPSPVMSRTSATTDFSTTSNASSSVSSSNSTSISQTFTLSGNQKGTSIGNTNISSTNSQSNAGAATGTTTGSSGNRSLTRASALTGAGLF